MLSRTADHLFWMSRYTERAENTARMLDVNYQTSLLPQSADTAEQGWRGLLTISELTPMFQQKYGDEFTARDVMQFMVRDEGNPSSIASCLRAARENARAVRGFGNQCSRQRIGSRALLRRERALPAIDRQSGEPDGQDPARCAWRRGQRLRAV